MIKDVNNDEDVKYFTQVTNDPEVLIGQGLSPDVLGKGGCTDTKKNASLEKIYISAPVHDSLRAVVDSSFGHRPP